MTWKIVTDSGCRIPGCEEVPFVINACGREYRDDDELDMEKMLCDIEESNSGCRTSCPSPHDWLEAYEGADNIVAVTMSSALSGSYNSAVVAKHMALERHPDKNICVLDSRAAGVLPESFARLVQKLASGSDGKTGMCRADVMCLEKKLRDMHVIFALGSLDNLIRAGRISKFAGHAAHTLRLSAIGAATLTGRIELRSKFRGRRKLDRKLLDMLHENGFAGGELVITHCLCPESAERLGQLIKEQWRDTDITVMEAGGLCGFYMGRGGMIITYIDKLQ